MWSRSGHGKIYDLPKEEVNTNLKLSELNRLDAINCHLKIKDLSQIVISFDAPELNVSKELIRDVQQLYYRWIFGPRVISAFGYRGFESTFLDSIRALNFESGHFQTFQDELTTREAYHMECTSLFKHILHEYERLLNVKIVGAGKGMFVCKDSSPIAYTGFYRPVEKGFRIIDHAKNFLHLGGDPKNILEFDLLGYVDGFPVVYFSNKTNPL